MTENQLRWFGQVPRRPWEASVRRVNCMFFSLMKRRGKLKRTLEEVVNRNLMAHNIFKILIFYQA
uniref:Uncharacterized protein n=1 Tax=Cajanus cajan TaxID=3821 RepID=A0A151T6K7_CAJCA|nr:hypothetical protein KK1_017196 [Cajanus cajan]